MPITPNERQYAIFANDTKRFLPGLHDVAGAEEFEGDGDYTVVEIHAVKNDVWHILTVENYYFNGGLLQLSITQPLVVALTIFAAMLVADERVHRELES